VSLTLNKISKLKNQLQVNLEKMTLTIKANEYLVNLTKLPANYITVTVARNNNNIDIVISNDSLASIGNNIFKLNLLNNVLNSAQVYIVLDLIIDSLNQQLATNLNLKKVQFNNLKQSEYTEIKVKYHNTEHSIYLTEKSITNFNEFTNNYFDYLNNNQDTVINLGNRFSFAVTLANTHLSAEEINNTQSGDLILLEDYLVNDVTVLNQVMIDIGNSSYLTAEIESNSNKARISNIYSKSN
jgi:hypothetical protein